MLRAIDHVQLAMPAGEEPRTRAFYADLLGLTEVEKPEKLKPQGGCWFELGDVRVHLGVEADFSPVKKAHPAFVCDELREMAAKLEQAGYPVQRDEHIPGVTRFFTADPFGNRIEIVGADR